MAVNEVSPDQRGGFDNSIVRDLAQRPIPGHRDFATFRTPKQPNPVTFGAREIFNTVEAAVTAISDLFKEIRRTKS